MANLLTLDLSQFKASGVYTVERDNSERITVTQQTLRFVPGFSATGPFNTPVFISSTGERQTFFGGNDPKLERLGSFFHRSIDTCLQKSPVFAINLLNLKDDDGMYNSSDTSGYGHFSLNMIKSTYNSFLDETSAPLASHYASYFNKDRFWKPDASYLQTIVSKKLNKDENISPLISFANTGTKNITLIALKAQVTGFDVTATDWYGDNESIPYTWIKPSDYISDYFVNIIAIEGNWTDSLSLVSSTQWNTYFNTSGLISDKLSYFLSDSRVKIIGNWTGCIIPNFVDASNSNRFIETIINNNTSITGLLCNINQEALEYMSSEGSYTDDSYLDLVGHSLVNAPSGTTKIDVMSYSTTFASGTDVVSVSIVTDVTLNKKQFKIASSDGSKISVGDFVFCADHITRVVSKIYKTEGQNSFYIISANDEPDTTGNKVSIVKNILSKVSTYKLFYMPGFKVTERHMPGYTTSGQRNNEAGVEKIYSVLEEEGVLRGLVNPDMIQYRYIVDTMAYGLGTQMGGKVHLSSLAKKRGKTTALLNAPSISQFAVNTDPYFCDVFDSTSDTTPKPAFNAKWVSTGGNPDMNRTFVFSLPDEEHGGKYCGIFGPFLRIFENNKYMLIPPAADVSNSFVNKFLGGDPYAVVANRNGIISNSKIAGVEYMLDQQDRSYLEPFGYNSIIERPVTNEVMIYSNATSFQKIKTDYNYLHVRELLNTIEIQADQVLQNFVFEPNDALTRSSIINAIEPILQNMKNSGALYNYQIIMDETNNTSEIIDEGYGVIDIYVWITKSMQKIVNRITVNKLSTSNSGGSLYV